MYLKIHETSTSRVIAACDEDLLGKVFEEGKKELNLKTYAHFYKGLSFSEKEFVESLKKPFSSLNLVGKETISLAIKLKLCTKQDIKTISSIPYVQVYKL